MDSNDKGALRVGWLLSAVLIAGLFILTSCIHPSHAAGKSEKEQFCMGLAKVSATAASRVGEGVPAGIVRKVFLDQSAIIKDSVTREWVMAAVDFGIYMAPHYPPSEIARYQYFGCLSTA